MAKVSSRVTLPEGILSFPQLFEAKVFGDGGPKYSLNIIFDKDADLSGLEAAVAVAIDKKWGGNPPKKLVLPIKDGNTRKDADDVQRPEYADKRFIMSSSNVPDAPGVVDAAVSPIMDQNAIYGGCVCRVVVSAYGWEYAGKNGVSLYLKNVMKVRDGDPFTVPVSVEDDFA